MSFMPVGNYIYIYLTCFMFQGPLVLSVNHWNMNNTKPNSSTLFRYGLHL